MTEQIFLPGDRIPGELIPTATKRKIHPSIKYVPTIPELPHQSQHQNRQRTTEHESGYFSSIAGPLRADHRKKTASITSNPRARYIPQPGDPVIAQIRLSSQEVFHAYITPHGQQAILGHMSFEGATKKTRPQLKAGDLVYAKVVAATKGMDVEISCVNPSTGKADGFGPLTNSASSGSTSTNTTTTTTTGSGGGGGGGGGSGGAHNTNVSSIGGHVFDVSVGFAERLLRKEGVAGLTDELTTKIPGGFEFAVGRNGRVWVSCPEAGVAGCILVARTLSMADEAGLTETEQKKAVRRLAAEMKLG